MNVNALQYIHNNTKIQINKHLKNNKEKIDTRKSFIFRIIFKELFSKMLN